MLSYRRQWIALGTFIIAVQFFAMVLMPITAQDGVPAFATNTPSSAVPLSFATNTPQPSAAILNVPDAPMNRYALRTWDEASLVDVLLDQVRLLHDGEVDRAAGIQLVQNELQHRFPGAPHDVGKRADMLLAMLNAPLGSVDMRFVVRPTIEAVLNRLKPSFASNSAFTDAGFTISITPANVNGARGEGAVIFIQYPSSGDKPLYQDYVMAVIDPQGNYRVLSADSPAVPFDDLQTLTLEGVGDFNGDGLDEMAVSVYRSGDTNAQLMIWGWRGSTVVSLIQPGQHIYFFGDIQWNSNDLSLAVQEYQVESPAWQCLSTRDVRWAWSLNFFRPAGEPGKFTLQNRLGCLLFGMEPIYQMPLSIAINTIEQAAPYATVDDEYAANRAALMLVMLNVLSGDLSQAVDQVKQLQAKAQPGSWLEKQTTAFLQAASGSSLTPLQLCAVLQDASPYGACDVNQVLARLFKDQPLRRDEPIEAQVARFGLSVLDQTTVKTFGRLDRQAVHFDLAGSQWWAFAPLEDDILTAEKIDVPPGYEPIRAPTLLLTPPQKAYDALLVSNDAREVLNILDNLVQSNPGAKLDGSALFLEALSYDLLADRTNARQTYFELWSAEPTSVWGQLAASHLERR